MPVCNALKNHMCVTVDASWRPCCRFNKFPRVNINDVNFESYKSSEFYQKIISDMESGWAEGCNKCQQEEARGQTSLREVLNRDLSGSDDVEYIELSLSNKCNLACKMCSPTYSTLWNDIVTKNEDLSNYHHTVVQPLINVDEVFSNVNLEKLKKIKYLGGEPFITPEIKKLFEYLEHKNIIQNIEFECNTNCTLFPDKWLKYLDKFRKVTIELSLDGIGSINDYVRFGKKWSDIEPNIFKWSKHSKQSNVSLNIFSTVQAYNLHDMKNVKLLADSLKIKHYSSLLVVPNFLSVHVLPKKYLDEIKDDYNQKYYSSIHTNDSLFEEFKNYTSKMDNATRLFLKDVNLALYTYMEEQNGR